MTYTRAIFYSSLSVFTLCFLIGFFMSASAEGLGIPLITGLIASIVNVFGSLVVALPAHEILQIHKINHWVAYALVGFIAPILIIFLLTLVNSGGIQAGTIIVSTIMGGFGLLSISVFWCCMYPNMGAEKKMDKVTPLVNLDDS